MKAQKIQEPIMIRILHIKLHSTARQLFKPRKGIFFKVYFIYFLNLIQSYIYIGEEHLFSYYYFIYDL